MSILKRLFGGSPTPPAQLLATEASPARDDVWAAMRREGWREDLPNDHPPFILPAIDFFRGNNEVGSIAPNLVGLANAPPHAAFGQVFAQVSAQPSVSGVFVSLHEDSEPSMWPTSDTVYIVTSAPIEHVRSWVASLGPDDVREAGEAISIANPFPVPPGQRACIVWWD